MITLTGKQTGLQTQGEPSPTARRLALDPASAPRRGRSCTGNTSKPLTVLARNRLCEEAQSLVFRDLMGGMNENPLRASLSFLDWRDVPLNRAEEEGREGRASPKTQAHRSWAGRVGAPGEGTHGGRRPRRAHRAPQAKARRLGDRRRVKGLPSISSPRRAWFQNQNKLGRVRREGGEKERNKESFTYVSSQPTVSALNSAA